MKIFLTSGFETNYKDENGRRIPVMIKDENKFVTNLKKSLNGNSRVVWVANDSKCYEQNDERATVFFKSLALTGLQFDRHFVLDKRNQKKAKQILSGADLVILSGGKCLCQSKFFKRIKLKEILQEFQGAVIGISAGTMNLCNVVANFPEEKRDLRERRWLKGLGFFDEIIIPHFDGENVCYQFECPEVDLINDYVLPMSKNRKFIGLPNCSYIMVDSNGKAKIFGDAYEILDGKVTKIKKHG